MLEFTPLCLDDIAKIRPFYEKSKSQICDNTIGGCFMWRDFFKTSYAFAQDTLVFRVVYTNNQVAFSVPIGPNVEEALKAIEEYCTKQHIPMILCSVVKKDKEMLSNLYEVDITTERDWFDYLYNAADLSTMAGRKYAGQRNHINFFLKENPEYTIETVSSLNMKMVKSFFQQYNDDTDKKSKTFQEERDKVLEVLDHFDEYCQNGIMLMVGKNIVGFSLGEVVGDTLFVHIEKADRTVRGAYQILVREFVKQNMDKGIIYVNREEDVGDLGLRKSKESYHPCAMLEKSTVLIMNTKNK